MKVKVFLERWTKYFRKHTIFSKAAKNFFLKIAQGNSHTFRLLLFSESKTLCFILLSCHYAKTLLAKLSLAVITMLRRFGLYIVTWSTFKKFMAQ